MLEKVKKELRISHTKLDDVLQDSIDAAKAELQRLGILESKIVETDPAIADAIKVFCLYRHGLVDNRDGYFQSWQYQTDCLRKTTDYVEAVV